MSVTTTVTVEERPVAASGQRPAEPEPYRYAHLLPSFSQETYPPLTLFEHVDPGSRALSHPDPRSFLARAKSVTQLTPNLGSEIHGVSLASLSGTERDQVALEVRYFQEPDEVFFIVLSSSRSLGAVFLSSEISKNS
jgi:sulfonate dioxygenase